MRNYSIFFDFDHMHFRLPVNPEELEMSSVQAIEKYEILKLGQIAVPTHIELTEYSFEAEFPHEVLSYVDKPDKFISASTFLKIFKELRESLIPVRFIASSGIGDDINSLVLIEELNITEKAGEEGDKYVSFKLLEYREYGKKIAIEKEKTSSGSAKVKKKKATKEEVNPKSKGYHIVVSGDSLWSIAKKYYGDGSKCNIIYNANKDKIKNPALISVGWKLRIPTKDEFSKYSAPLPKSITIKDEYAKAIIEKVTEKVAAFGRWFHGIFD